MRLFAGLTLALALTGCTSSGFELIVDLRTDLRPGYDFAVVRTSVVEAPAPSVEGERRTLAAATTDDYVAGERVAELRDLPAGSYLIAVELLDAASVVVAGRRARVDVSGPRSVSVVITSECFGVRCPGLIDPPSATECSAGRCVSPECTADNPEACGVGGCTSDADCPAIVSCSVGRCTGGACFQAPDDARCPSGSYCDIIDGCAAIPAMDAGAPPSDGGGLDAATADAGRDAGPSCSPAACDDLDPCTDDVCAPGGGCLHPARCGAGEYCDAGACHPEPTFAVATTDGFGCADLGVDHSSPSRFLWRRTVTGRPGATFTQYNRHVGCGDSPSPAESHDLDATGRYEDESLGDASTDCDSAFLGRYSAYVEVDGRTSSPVELTYFNSRCPGVATCSAARSYCPPCRDCDPGTEYCYASSSCAPSPTIAIATGEGGGCADLGTAHASPAFLWRRTVTGRPGATATQYNEHVSCGGPVTEAETITLDGAGRDVSQSENGADTNCASPFLGRYRVYVEVDGERSATTEVTYFNSSCPGVATCAAARSYCAP